MHKYSHPTKKIPLHRGHVMQLAKELKMHRNTLLKRWERGDPRILYAIAIRQTELAYPCRAQLLQQLKQCLLESYRLQMHSGSNDEHR